MALGIISNMEGTTLTMEFSGRLGTLEAREFDAAFAEKAMGMKQALLDFSKVEYISSAGLRCLFTAKKKMTQQGGELTLLYPSREVGEVLQATRFDNLIKVVWREEEENASRFYPLRPIQRWMVDTHFMKARSTMMNTGALIRLDSSTDMERLAAAVNDVLAAYDIFRCRLVIHPETGDICQRFDGELTRVYVETLSDEAFEQRKQEVKQPYELIDHPLYRIYLMVTSTAKYLYADFYHAIMDGAAIAMLFFREMDKRYIRPERGGKTGRQPASYAEYILEEAGIPEAELQAGHEYWNKMLAGFDESRHLPPADVDGASDTPEHEIEVPFPVIEKDFFRGKDFNENSFFIGASLLALAKSTGSREAIMGWVHNGRVTLSEKRLMGLMLDQFPIRWDFNEDITAASFLRGLEARINEGMQYRKSLDMVYASGLEDECAGFILQKGNLGRRGTVKLGGMEGVIEEMPANEISAAENTLDIEVNAHDDGSFSLVLDYDNNRYSEAAMRRFAEIMKDMVVALQDGDCVVTDLLK
jgi:anti-anti-sigma factor